LFDLIFQYQLQFSFYSCIQFADVLRSSLQQSFCDRDAVRVIVECGSYFVESAFTVAVGVLDERTEFRNLNDVSPGRLFIILTLLVALTIMMC